MNLIAIIQACFWDTITRHDCIIHNGTEMRFEYAIRKNNEVRKRWYFRYEYFLYGRKCHSEEIWKNDVVIRKRWYYPNGKRHIEEIWKDNKKDEIRKWDVNGKLIYMNLEIDLEIEMKPKN